MKHVLTVFGLLLALNLVYTQSSINQFLTPSDSLNTKRKRAVVITEATLASLSLIGLNQLWYQDYERSSFKVVDDSNEWLQMDKFGHTFSAYHLGRLTGNSLRWAGDSQSNQILYGAAFGLGFLTAVEVMDGFSEEWGFSWSDMAANALGTGLYASQELLWQEQRVLLKYSFHRTSFAEQRPELLGDGLHEELLKDYNGQTYWLSANIEAFLKTDALPKWLNLAFGYSGDGMLTGDPNDVMFPNQNRIRQYFLSLDVDLSRIKTNSAILRTVFDVLNLIKVPLPTLQINSTGQLKWHLFYF
ncbi:DUF2279 domain-containing protein [uncultured Winogradskyella sp.]|uniref:DUF2279 domain-containing protein n=1 Tax=uncultured Winogradskyella sp. TaxID=395353 RepID=UPI0035125F34